MFVVENEGVTEPREAEVWTLERSLCGVSSSTCIPFLGNSFRTREAKEPERVAN
jgi:hypothetical protein